MLNAQISQAREQALANQNLTVVGIQDGDNSIPGIYVDNRMGTGNISLIKLSTSNILADSQTLEPINASLILDFIGARVQQFLLNHLSEELGYKAVNVPEVSIIHLEEGVWGLKIKYIQGAVTLERLAKQSQTAAKQSQRRAFLGQDNHNGGSVKFSRNIKDYILNTPEQHSLLFPIAHDCGDSDPSLPNVMQTPDGIIHRIDFGHFLTYVFGNLDSFIELEKKVTIDGGYAAEKIESGLSSRTPTYALLADPSNLELRIGLRNTLQLAINELESTLSKVSGFNLANVSFKNYFKSYSGQPAQLDLAFADFTQLREKIHRSLINNFSISGTVAAARSTVSEQNPQEHQDYDQLTPPTTPRASSASTTDDSSDSHSSDDENHTPESNLSESDNELAPRNLSLLFETMDTSQNLDSSFDISQTSSASSSFVLNTSLSSSSPTQPSFNFPACLSLQHELDENTAPNLGTNTPPPVVNHDSPTLPGFPSCFAFPMATPATPRRFSTHLKAPRNLSLNYEIMIPSSSPTLPLDTNQTGFMLSTSLSSPHNLASPIATPSSGLKRKFVELPPRTFGTDLTNLKLPSLNEDGQAFGR